MKNYLHPFYPIYILSGQYGKTPLELAKVQNKSDGVFEYQKNYAKAHV